MDKTIQKSKYIGKLLQKKSINKKNLDYLKATMSYEDLDLPTDILKIISDNIKGKISNQEARNRILKKHGLV